MKVSEAMIPLSQTPTVGLKSMMKQALEVMTLHALGIVCIVDEDGVLMAVLTDGDLRRTLLRVQKPVAALMADDVLDHATSQMGKIASEADLIQAATLMEQLQVWDLPVVDAGGHLSGLIHLHHVFEKLLEQQIDKPNLGKHNVSSS